jgi:uncharacterized membrane protein
MEIESSKNLGGVGALLIFIGPILSVLPRVGAWTGLLSLVGAILVLIALKGFADYYREAGIFNNALYAIITAVVGAVATIGVVFVAFVDLFAELGIQIADFQDGSRLGEIFSEATNFDVILRFAGIIILALVILFIVLVITAFFLRRSLILMASKTGVGLFGTTGLMLLLGAVFTIIFGLGILLFWISMLLLAIAFFSIRPQQPPPASTTSTQTPTQV